MTRTSTVHVELPTTVDDPAWAELSRTLGRARSAVAVIVSTTGVAAEVPERSEAVVAAWRDQLAGVLQRLLHAPVPTIASVRGSVTGPPLPLVLAADVVVAAADAELIPILPSGMPVPGVAWAYQRRGGRRAQASLVLARRLAADEAGALGLFDDVVDPADLDSHVEQLVGTLGSSAHGRVRALRVPAELDPVLRLRYDAELAFGP